MQITSAVDELTRDRKAMNLVAANREVWEMLRDGVRVSVPDREPIALSARKQR